MVSFWIVLEKYLVFLDNCFFLILLIFKFHFCAVEKSVGFSALIHMILDKSHVGEYGEHHKHIKGVEEKWAVVAVCMQFITSDHLLPFLEGSRSSLDLRKGSLPKIRDILNKMHIQSCDSDTKKISFNLPAVHKR